MMTSSIEARGARLKRIVNYCCSWRPLFDGWSHSVIRDRLSSKNLAVFGPVTKRMCYRSSPMLQLLRQITSQQEAWMRASGSQTPGELRLATQGRSTIIKSEVIDLTEEDDPSLLELLQL